MRELARRVAVSGADAATGLELWLLDVQALVGPAPVAGTEGLRAAEAVLDDDERRRAQTLRREDDRVAYVAAHALVRELLGERLGTLASELRFAVEPCPRCGGPHGRPVVAGPPGERVEFSLSHGARLALVGLARTPIGVDVEAVPAVGVATDVGALLHPTERAELARADWAPEAFTRAWARKEAYLKALGVGIVEDLDTVYVGAGATPVPPPGYRLFDVAVPARHAAAVALADR